MKPSASKLLYRLRLLPIVLAVGVPLLVLKGMGVVRDAQAQEAPANNGDSAPPDQVAANDPAADDAPTASAAQVEVLTSLAKRRTQLDARAAEIGERENLLAATEKRVDEKIATLKQLQSQIQQLLATRDAEQEKQLSSLVKTYSAMKPKDAARIFNALDEQVLIQVAQAMKPDALAPILSNMQAEAAQKLTLKLANRLALPDAPAAPPPAPGLQASTATPPPDAAALAAAAPAQAFPAPPINPAGVPPLPTPTAQASPPQSKIQTPHG